MPAHLPHPHRDWKGEVVEVPSGDVAAWEEAVHPEYSFEQHWIPGTGDAAQTGWYGAGGVEEFLLWAKQRREFRIYLDRDGVDFHRVKVVAGDDAIEDGREASKPTFYWFRARVRDLDDVPFEP